MKKIFFILIIVTCSASYCGSKQEWHATITIINRSVLNASYDFMIGSRLDENGAFECAPNGMIVLPGFTLTLAGEINYFKAPVDMVWEQCLSNCML